MISVIVLTRNAPTLARHCFESLLACADTLARVGGAGGVEFILADDHSDDVHAVAPLLKYFAARLAPHPTRAFRFRRQVHYAHGLAYTFSMARGDDVLFVSHDMILTPDCIEELHDRSRADATAGVLRPTSAHMDWARAHAVAPPEPPRTMNDVFATSAAVRARSRGQVVDWPMLIGDAMWVTRATLDRIGVFDTRFYGFWADIDYGVRLHRAGLRHAIARGAWLHHEGNGANKESAAAAGRPIGDKQQEVLELARSAYELFRGKWDPTLPADFKAIRRADFDRLHAAPASPAARLFHPPVPPPPELIEEL